MRPEPAKAEYRTRNNIILFDGLACSQGQLALAAGQKRSKRHVGLEAEADGVAEQFP